MKIAIKREKFEDDQVIEIYDYESTSVGSNTHHPDVDKSKGVVLKKTWLDYLEHAPKIIGALVFVSVIGFALYDWRQMIEIFKGLIEWVKLEPGKAAIVIFFVYILLILFSMPIVFFSVPLGYAFHLAFEGKFGKKLTLIWCSRLPFRFFCSLFGNNHWRHPSVYFK